MSGLPHPGAAVKPVGADLSLDELMYGGWCDGVRALGSYWTRHDDTDLASRLARYFKDSLQTSPQQTQFLPLIRAYAAMMVSMASEWKPSALIRILASDETQLDRRKPQSILAESIANHLKIPDMSHIFFRSSPRQPMRAIGALEGSKALRRRLSYVRQDLFIRPAKINGTIMLVDDIYNLGATSTVYAAALKRFCGASRVYGLNLAATRFHNGKDGWGYLKLDVDSLIALIKEYSGNNSRIDSFDRVWIERNEPQYHLSPDCRAIMGASHISLRFLAQIDRTPCASCTESERSIKSGAKWVDKLMHIVTRGDSV